MQTFFITSTGVQWSDIMYQAAQSRGVDLVPANYILSPLAAIFFVIGVVIGNFFLMN